MVDVAEDGLAITAEELRAFDGTDGAPLYLAIMGRVYDVSKGQVCRSAAAPRLRGKSRSCCYRCLSWTANPN